MGKLDRMNRILATHFVDSVNSVQFSALPIRDIRVIRGSSSLAEFVVTTSLRKNRKNFA